nr:MAG TPA: hypothetical protein [Caudoviricetes sp.]
MKEALEFLGIFFVAIGIVKLIIHLVKERK